MTRCAYCRRFDREPIILEWRSWRTGERFRFCSLWCWYRWPIREAWRDWRGLPAAPVGAAHEDQT